MPVKSTPMPEPFMRSLAMTFKNEAAIIGRLVAGVTELEIGLLHCISNATGDLDAALKKMFRRHQGGKRRITAAAELGQQSFDKLKMGAEFGTVIRAMKHCVEIRNKYAHWNCYDDTTDRLAFTNLEQLAEETGTVNSFENLTKHYADVPLLQKQEAYFLYTDHLLSWVNFESRYRAGTLPSNPFEKPTPMEPPPFFINEIS